PPPAPRPRTAEKGPRGKGPSLIRAWLDRCVSLYFRSTRGCIFGSAESMAHREEIAMYETLDIRREGNLTWLVLNRPDALNAMSLTLIREVSDFFQGLPDDRETRVVVMRGSGRAFCAGLDLKDPAHAESSGGSSWGRLHGQRRVSEIVMRMR